jgi:hypothetical protein
MVKEKLPFMSIDEAGLRAAKYTEEWAKWALDVLRNFVVVAFLFYVADKSGKWYMWIFAGIGAFALYMYVTAYVNQSQFNIGSAEGIGKILFRLFTVLIAFLFVTAFTLGTIVAFYSAIKEIAVIQAK